MKANELRIGNWLNHFNDTVIVQSIKHDPAYYLIWCVKDNGYTSVANRVDGFDGIPLTEDWLVKFGFELTEDSWFYSLDFDKTKETFKIFPTTNDKFHTLGLDQFNMNIEYVHQLQNLYFALTGEELIEKL